MFICNLETAGPVSIECLQFDKFQFYYGTGKKNKLCGFGPLANYADRATAASWRSSANFCG
jgi:hypothetical protein